MKRTALSEQHKLQQLFTGENLGDRKPSQLLRRMQQLLGDRPGLDNSFLRELFLQRLPPNVRMVLPSTPDGTTIDGATIDKLAETSDKIMEVAAPSVAAMATHPSAGVPPSDLTSEFGHLRSEIQRLEKLMNTFARNHSPSRPNTRPSRRSPTPPPTRNSSDAFYWYNRKFGDQARTCRSPCSWSPNGQASH